MSVISKRATIHRIRPSVHRVVKSSLLFVLIMVSGCFNLPKYSLPVDALILSDSPARCRELQPPDSELQSMRALVDVTFNYKDEAAHFRYAIIARQPDAFRVDILPDGGAFTLGMLVTSAGVTTILDAQEKSYVRGRDESALIERFLRIPGFSRDVVIGMVAGLLPKLSCDKVTVRARPGGEYLLEDASNSVVWHFDTLTRSVRGVTGVTEDGKSVRYEVRRLGEETQQTSISLSVYDPVDATATMELRKLTLNGRLGDELFRVTIPGGYRDNS
jgi:hypothetical protein